MPALLLALGSAFSWLASTLVAGFASLATQKAVRFVVAALMLPIVLGWLTQHLGGVSPFDLGNLLGAYLGGLPATMAWVLDAFGFVAFAFVVLKIEVSAFVVTLLMRVFGVGK